MPFSRYHGVFNPADLDVLSRVFLRICIDRGLTDDKSATEELAVRLVSLRNAGINDEAELLAAVAERDANRQSDGAYLGPGCLSVGDHLHLRLLVPLVVRLNE